MSAREIGNMDELWRLAAEEKRTGKELHAWAVIGYIESHDCDQELVEIAQRVRFGHTNIFPACSSVRAWLERQSMGWRKVAPCAGAHTKP